MTIETKFNVGDEVYFMKDNRVKRGKVQSIILPTIESSAMPQIKYTLLSETTYEYEHLLFKTKEELLQSL